MVVKGTAGTLTPRGSVTMAEMIAQEDDMENLRENHSNPTSPRTPLDVTLEYAMKAHRSPTSQVEGNTNDRDILKLAARTVSIFFVLFFFVGIAYAEKNKVAVIRYLLNVRRMGQVVW